MGIGAIIGLIFTIITKLPSMIRVGFQIIKLLPKFKDGGLANDLVVLGEILALILGIAQDNPALAKESLKDLRDALKDGQPLEDVSADLKVKVGTPDLAPKL